ncbi:hypothetical protein EH221_01995, partial [bacterium]
YSASLQPVFLPKGSGIPDREIVFLSVDDKEYYLGFINPDGSGLETRTVKMTTGISGYDSRLRKYTEWFHQEIQWTENGDAVGMQNLKYAPTNGIPFLINLEGEFTTCPVESDPIPMGLYNTGSIQFLGDGMLLSAANSVGIETVTLFDMRTCQKIDELYKPTENEYLRGARLSNIDWFALWHIVNIQEQITIFSPDKTVQAVIEDAQQPAWSKDGEHLAFIKKDGLYITSKDGTETRKILEGYINCPSWSPDGEKMVIEYLNNKKFNIAIVDIPTGELTIIAENGYCPDWR